MPPAGMSGAATSLRHPVNAQGVPPLLRRQGSLFLTIGERPHHDFNFHRLARYRPIARPPHHLIGTGSATAGTTGTRSRTCTSLPARWGRLARECGIENLAYGALVPDIRSRVSHGETTMRSIIADAGPGIRKR